MKLSDLIAIAIGIAIGFFPLGIIYFTQESYVKPQSIVVHAQTVDDTLFAGGGNDRYRYHSGLDRLLCKIDKYIDWDTVHVR